jgi:hypothetical protein
MKKIDVVGIDNAGLLEARFFDEAMEEIIF